MVRTIFNPILILICLATIIAILTPLIQSQIISTSLTDRVIHVKEKIDFTLIDGTKPGRTTTVKYQYWDKISEEFVDPSVGEILLNGEYTPLQSEFHFNALEALYSSAGTNPITLPSYPKLTGVWIQLTVSIEDQPDTKIQALLISSCDYMASFGGKSLSLGPSSCHPKQNVDTISYSYYACSLKWETVDGVAQSSFRHGDRCQFSDFSLFKSSQTGWDTLLHDSPGSGTAFLSSIDQISVRDQDDNPVTQAWSDGISSDKLTLHLVDSLGSQPRTSTRSFISSMFDPIGYANNDQITPIFYNARITATNSNAIVAVSHLPDLLVFPAVVYNYLKAVRLNSQIDYWSETTEPGQKCNQYRVVSETSIQATVSGGKAVSIKIIRSTAQSDNGSIGTIPTINPRPLRAMIRSYHGGIYYLPHKLSAMESISVMGEATINSVRTITYATQLVFDQPLPPGDWEIVMFFDVSPDWELNQCVKIAPIIVDPAATPLPTQNGGFHTKIFKDSYLLRIEHRDIDPRSLLQSPKYSLPPYYMQQDPDDGDLKIMIPLYYSTMPVINHYYNRPLSSTNPAHYATNNEQTIYLPLTDSNNLYIAEIKSTPENGCGTKEIVPNKQQFHQNENVNFNFMNYGGQNGPNTFGIEWSSNSGFVSQSSTTEDNHYTDQSQFFFSFLPAFSGGIIYFRSYSSSSTTCPLGPSTSITILPSVTCPTFDLISIKSTSAGRYRVKYTSPTILLSHIEEYSAVVFQDNKIAVEHTIDPDSIRGKSNSLDDKYDVFALDIEPNQLLKPNTNYNIQFKTPTACVVKQNDEAINYFQISNCALIAPLQPISVSNFQFYLLGLTLNLHTVWSYDLNPTKVEVVTTDGVREALVDEAKNDNISTITSRESLMPITGSRITLTVAPKIGPDNNNMEICATTSYNNIQVTNECPIGLQLTNNNIIPFDSLGTNYSFKISYEHIITGYTDSGYDKILNYLSIPGIGLITMAPKGTTDVIEVASWDFDPSTKTITITPKLFRFTTSEIEITFKYHELCSSATIIQFSYADEIKSTKQESDGRFIHLGWVMPQQRMLNLIGGANPDFYKFTFFTKPVGAFAIQHDNNGDDKMSTQEISYPMTFILHGSVSFFNPPNGQLSAPIGNSTLISFPDNAYQVRLELPELPNDDPIGGFIVRMEPVDYNPNDLDAYVYSWSFDSADDYRSPCSSITCHSNGNDQCNGFTQQCERKTTGVEMLTPLSLYNSQGLCTLAKSCPRYFVPNSACTQCICTSTDCMRYTKSFQIELNQKTGDLLTTKKTLTLFQQYLKIRLTLAMGLSNTPHHLIPSDYSKSYPRNEVEQYATEPVGLEEVFVNILNPVQPPPYFYSTLLITFTVSPTTSSVSSSKLSTRFSDISKALKELVTKYSEKVFLDNAYLFPATLPFPIFFKDFESQDLTSFNLYKRITTDTTTTGITSTTRCAPMKTTSSNTPSSPGACPTPTPLLFTRSLYWSDCANDQRTLVPSCIDYLGKSHSKSTSWCGHGWYDYPSVTRINGCASTEQLITTPDVIKWVSDFSNAKPVNSGDMIKLEWMWPSTQYSNTYTIDILFASGLTPYSTLLATTLAVDQQVMVVVPKIAKDAPNATITLRCTQKISSRSTPLPISTKGTKHCPEGNPCDASPGSACNKNSGECECLNGFERSAAAEPALATPYCQPLCTRKCALASDCTIEAPDTCKKCPEGKAGPLCQVDSGVCGNEDNGLNTELCSARGYITLLSQNTCSAQCTCPNHWGDNDCSKCLLLENATESNNDDIKCVAQNTDHQMTLSRSNSNGYCSQCICLPGYYGSHCEIAAIRSHATFQLDTPSSFSTKLSLFMSSSTYLTENVNGMHFVTPEGREVLQRDTALSIGVPPSSVNIISIHQATINPTASSLALPPTTTNHNTISTTSTSTSPIQTSTPYTQTTVRYSISPTPNQGGFETLEDLSSLWNSMSGTLPTLPINDGETCGEVGLLTGVGDVVMPGEQMTDIDNSCPAGRECNCAIEEKLSNGGYCSPSQPVKKSSVTPIIIGVVVGVGVVIILFVVTIVVINWAKKNERMCFAPAKKSGSSNNNTKKSNTDGNKVELTISNTTLASSSSQPTQGQSITSSASVDLVPLTDHGEALPDGWSKHQHTVTGDQFYVYIKDGEMKSQRKSPLEDQEDDDLGW